MEVVTSPPTNTTAVQLDEPARALLAEHVRKLLDMMGFPSVSVATAVDNENRLHINLMAGDDSRLLIGVKGNHLYALQHIIRCVLRAHFSQPVSIIVDVNNYRMRHEQSVINLARQSAKKAYQSGKTVVLQPMNAADRRLVHTELATQKQVQTESLGEEPDRRVVIRPIFL